MPSRGITVGVNTDNFHPVHAEWLPFPPKGIKYRELEPGFKQADGFWPYVELDRLFTVCKFYAKTTANTDVLHSHNSCISGKTSWVIDLETVGPAFPSTRLEKLTNFQDSILEKMFRLNERYVKKDSLLIPAIQRTLASDYCKKIMPWSEYGKGKCMKYLDKGARKKLEVVCPAIRQIDSRYRESRGRLNLLFVGNDFSRKGGDALLAAFETLEKKYDLQLTIVSNFNSNESVPEGILKRIEKNENIILKSDIGREILLREYYPDADIFLLPTKREAFGFVLLEAMANSVPVIATNIGAIPEIVGDEEAGLFLDASRFYHKPAGRFLPSLFDRHLKNELISRASALIEDSNLRKSLAKGAKKRAMRKFSLKIRNKKMGRIYEEAARR